MGLPKCTGFLLVVSGVEGQGFLGGVVLQILFYFMYMGRCVTCICVCTEYTGSALGSQKKAPDALELGYR